MGTGFVIAGVNEVVMFSNGPLDFFNAPHNQVASTVMNMTFSLTLRRTQPQIGRDTVLRCP